MSDPNSKSSDTLSDGPVKYILRPVIMPFLFCWKQRIEQMGQIESGKNPCEESMNPCHVYFKIMYLQKKTYLASLNNHTSL